MTVTKYKNGLEIDCWACHTIDNVFEMAKICLKQLNLHPSVKCQFWGNNNNGMLTIDAGDFYKFEIQLGSSS